MNSVLKEQLDKLKVLKFDVDFVPATTIPEEFTEIVFHKTSKVLQTSSELMVTFEKYIYKPSETFDFHNKFNNGVAPVDQVMFGKILKQTEKMYYFDLHTYEGERTWQGWCPKKSCTIKSRDKE